MPGYEQYKHHSKYQFDNYNKILIFWWGYGGGGVSVVYGTARHGTARHGTARHGTARHGTARHGTARHGTARHGTARHGTARHGTARHGTARHGTARHGTARHGTARHGTARHGNYRINALQWCGSFFYGIVYCPMLVIHNKIQFGCLCINQTSITVNIHLIITTKY